ncbi:MAG TPA: DUF58 domain-containing protein [Cyclobacteriaceae bacterium]|nr:DUF58 domain-containing protein [Cyclobacteriaceae bacterium]HMV09588.1 DUF58 domain-containing protein [Cyclobacteriaceae bacterium]HMV88959.1 DUF58 domain-containing protein [Cyclobacteriaceae bacterium]HMX01080.1 DUF58 domain-containing protein [Cyclobacteriaceae bacterium]HMX51896.1 DUF58 domain-containing protein [Cyclobacteriaceae bacterium]
MNPQLKDLFRPEIINTVNGLELIARIIVEGFISGSNRSQSIGIGQEFSQYRGYEPGDDLRLLDWKMYARSERYFVKLSEIETNITIKFIVDASHSMSYSENGLSKLHYAKVMTAALAYLARKQSDAVGLYGINDKHPEIVLARFETQQFMRFVNALVQLKSEGQWGRKTESLIDHTGKEMIVFITDLYDQNNDLLSFISRLKTSRNEVIVFHLMGKNEHDLSYEGAFTFEDLETGARVKVDTAVKQKAYKQLMDEWIGTVRNTLLEKGISYTLVTLNAPVENTLRDFLKARKQLLR